MTKYQSGYAFHLHHAAVSQQLRLKPAILIHATVTFAACGGSSTLDCQFTFQSVEEKQTTVSDGGCPTRLSASWLMLMLMTDCGITAAERISVPQRSLCTFHEQTPNICAMLSSRCRPNSDHTVALIHIVSVGAVVKSHSQTKEEMCSVDMPSTWVTSTLFLSLSKYVKGSTKCLIGRL